MAKCPRCESPSPELHPAVQFEGEVEICGYDAYHEPATSQALARIEHQRVAVLKKIDDNLAAIRSENQHLSDRKGKV